MKNKVHCKDNLKLMETLPSKSIDLIYLDPPFLTGRDFKEYDDRWFDMGYFLEYMDLRLWHCHRLLKDTGSLYLHCDYRTNYKLRVLLDNIFGEKNFANEIVWHFPSLSIIKNKFPNKHNTILAYTKTENHIFNFNDIRIPYAESTIKRAQSRHSFSNDSNYLNTGGKIPDTVWKIPHLSKKQQYPTQKPLTLLERIIKASSNEGDLVADFFCGSGTTLVAAKNLKRQYLGCDKNPEAVKITKERLQCQ